MRPATIVACLAVISAAYADTAGEHTSGATFCYNDGESCGPSHEEGWGGVCQSGKRQSPIDLPLFASRASGEFPLDKTAYNGRVFRIQNNGHSVAFDFAGTGPHTKVFRFPDPRTSEMRDYKFAAGHFHWGESDLSQGSEHCIGNSCAAMEMHLVHYLAKYGSMAEAVASKDENALSVVGVLVHMNKAQTLAGGLINMLSGKSATNGTGSVRNLIDAISTVSTAEHDTTKWTTVNKPLDFSPWLVEAFTPLAYTYIGSLTTPGCNEQVNWYVGKGRATTSHQDLQMLRSQPRDSTGQVLKRNNRPLQPLNGRQVNLIKVTSTIAKLFG